jgi:hypothetical protein
MQLIAIHPHMHMLGREMKVWARMKAESIKPLIHIDDWDFNWPGFYWFRTPGSRPVASWIELTAAWDNSASEPSTRWGTPPSSIRWTTRS